eukprot:gene1933-1073_t
MKKRKRETLNLVLFGTPIFLGEEENKDAMKIQGKYVPEHQQVVKDEQGRRRFHGAFTGGFSAGYFNTVGSAEGFTPSTFSSSRMKDGKNKMNRRGITDFMDEEDLKDINSNLQTNEEYSFQSSLDEKKEKTISDLIIPKKDSIGVRLLEKMNWKKGEGIGNKIKIQKKKYGVSLPGQEEERNIIEISRKDIFVEILKPKDNLFGIDFDPHENLKEIKEIKNNTMNISSGFTMNEEDEMNEIYNVEDLKNKEIIQQHEEEEEEEEKEKEETNKVMNNSMNNMFGFILSKKKENHFLKEFKNINVPLNFKPSPTLIFDENEKTKIQSISKRSELLNEKILPSKPKIEKNEKDFKKLPDIMKSRFVFASNEIDSIQPSISSGLYESKPIKKEEIIKKKSKRIIYEWYPDRLLSKRFDIQHPNIEINFTGTKRNSTLSKPKVYDNLNIGAEIDLFERLNNEEKEINNESSEINEMKRPSIDIFKEIFEPKEEEEEEVNNNEILNEEEEEEEDIIIENEEEVNEDDIFTPNQKTNLMSNDQLNKKKMDNILISTKLNNESNKIKSDFLLDDEEEDHVDNFKPIYVPQNKIKQSNKKEESKVEQKSLKDLKKELKKLKKQLKKK